MANGIAQKLGAAGRALGILLGIWGVLGAIAFFADVLPERVETAGDEATAEAEPDLDAAGGDASDPGGEQPSAGSEIAGAPTGEDGQPTEASGEAPSEEPTPTGREPIRHVKVCGDVEHARVGVGSIVGDEAEEIVIICGREAQVFAPQEAGLARLARLKLEGEAQAKVAPPVITDVDGDGLNDLVLGWTDLDDEGGPDGGTMRWIPGDASGGFGEPRTLHALSVVDLVAAEIDGRPGTDLVAVHWADGFGRRPSEAWVFGGGPSPRRIARRRLRHDGVATDLADLDGDGHLDLITLDAEGVQIAEGDGTGRFPRFRSLPLEAPRDVVVMPAGAPRPPPPAPTEPAAPIEAGEAAEEPETHTDLVHLVGATMTTLDAEGQLGDPTPGAPHGVLRAHGLGDGAIVALTRQRVVRISHGSESTLVDLPGTFRPADLELMGRESDAPSLLVLGRTARGWELVEARTGSEGVVRLEPTAEPSEPKEAPLVLRLTLH